MRRSVIGMAALLFGGAGATLHLPLRAAAIVQQQPAAVTPAASAAGTGSLPAPRQPLAAAAPAHVKGQFLVKLNDRVSAPADVLFATGAGFKAATSDHSDSLDRLNSEHGVKSIRPLLRTAAIAAARTLAERRQLQATWLDAVNARYPQRAQRATHRGQTADLSHIYIFEIPEDVDVETACRRYQADPHVEYAQPNYIHTAQADPLPAVPVIPDDPYLEDPAMPGFWREGSWGQLYPDLWGLRNIHALEAWNRLAHPLTDPGAGVMVAIIDTGIDYYHPDIAANVWTNSAEIPNNGIDDDGNGYVDDVRGWDFTTIADCGGTVKPPSSNPMDNYGHGTHLAGTIAAIGNNGVGVIGIAPGAVVQAVKGLNDFGCGSSSDLANAILYATDNGADIINMSWGHFGTDPVIEGAVQQAHALGVVLVAAAGNSAVDLSTFPFAPASFPAVITASACDQNDQLTDFSNYGEKIDVTAPGGGVAEPPPITCPECNILSLRAAFSKFSPSLTVGDRYVRLAGTSMAAPHVAGVAALILGTHPQFSNEDVRQALRVSADDTGAPGFDPSAGYGRVNAEHAVQIDSVLTVTIDSPTNQAVLQPASGEAIPIQGTANGTGFLSYQVLVGQGNTPTTFVPLMAPSTTPVISGGLADWVPTSTDQEGRYTILLQAQDAQGRVFEARRPVILDRVSLAGWPVIEPSFNYSGGVAVGDIGLSPGNSVVAWGEDWQGVTGIYAWSRDGEPLFRIAPAAPTARFDAPPTLGDLDGDGKSEVIVGSTRGLLVIHNGSLSATEFPEWNFAAHPAVVEDLDGDGRPELIAIGDPGILWHPGAHIVALGWNGTSYSVLWTQQPFVTESGVPPSSTDLAVGDLDGDGKKEVVVAMTTTQEATAHVIYALGADGTIRWEHRIATPGIYNQDGSFDLVLGDVDGDGQLEVVFFRDGWLNASSGFGSDGDDWIVLDHRGNVKAQWATPFVQGERHSNTHVQLALADLDGDGKLEIVSAEEAGPLLPSWPRLYAWHHTGQPVTGFPAEFPELSAVGPAMIADVNGDGMPDIVGSLGMWRQDAINNPIYAWDASAQPLPGWPRLLVRRDLVTPGWIAQDAPVTLTDLSGTGTLDLVQSIGGDEIHAIDLGVPADPATMQWPTSRHDFARSGRFPPATGSACGNGVLDPGEQCDDGNRLNGDDCDANCSLPSCGNGLLDAGEECDDGNLTDGDGCSATCQSEMIPGGGLATYDCAQEWLTNPVPPRDRNGIPVNVLTCTDDDPACDFGPAAGDNTCTFHVAMCFNVTHRPGCTPLDVGQVRLLRPNEVQPADAVDTANRDALEGALAGLWGPVRGQCSVSYLMTQWPHISGRDYYCQTVRDCPGGLGRCQGRLVPFVPPLVGPNSCTGFANIAVPLQQTQSGALANGRRVLRLKTRPSRDPVSGRKRRAETDSLTLVCKVPS